MACTDPCDCPINKFDGLAAPTVNDDNCNTSGNGEFCKGSLWRDTSTAPNTWYIMTDETCTNAQWESISGKEPLTHFRGAVTAPPQSVPEADFNVPLDVTQIYNANPADTWDNVGKIFTVDQAGYYLFTGSALTVINNNTTARWFEGAFFQLLVYVNSNPATPIARKQPIEYLLNVDSQIILTGSSSLFLNASDQVQVRVSHRLGQTIDLIDDGGLVSNVWTIDRLADYQPL